VERTPIAKILPPARPAGFLARPALAERIATVLQRRLTVVVAEAGFGKSTLLASWWEAAPCAWYTADASDRELQSLARRLSDALRLRVPDLPGELGLPDAMTGPELDQLSRADTLASRLAEALHEQLTTELVLVIDDIHELAASKPSMRLIEALCRHAPRSLHVILAGRRAPSFPIERLRGWGQLHEITAEHLAFSPSEVAELAQMHLGVAATDIAGVLHGLAGGWPAAVILGIEALRESPPARWPDVLAGLARSQAPVFSYLAEEVFAHRSARVREVIRRVALLDEFTPELGDAVCMPGSRAVIKELAGQGLFIERRQDGSFALRPLIRDYALEQLALPAAQARDVRLAAAEWHANAGHIAAAVSLLLAAGQPDRLVALLAEHGQWLLSAGHVALVVDACRVLPPGLRSGVIDQLEGEAHQVQGDWAGALTCFERAARDAATLPAGLAWRMGVIHYLRGELDTALSLYRRGLDDLGADPRDTALVLAWAATVHWLRGEVELCRPLAARAFEIAEAAGDARALAATHTVLAMLGALDGDRRANDAHYVLALRAAEEAPDVLQIVRIRTNRASHFIEEGAYEEGLHELEVAIRLAELTSFTTFLALSLSNRGEARLRLGRLDEALSDFEESRVKSLETGSDVGAYALTGIAEIHRIRGNLALARSEYEEAIAISETSGDVQGLAPALAGLARVVAGDDPEAARELADRAIACGTGLFYASALLAAGWVAAAAGDPRRAGELAAKAGLIAQSRRDRSALAESLALAALSADEPRHHTDRLLEAASIWREIGDPLNEALAQLAVARIEPGPEAVVRRRAAERQLEIYGLRVRQGGNVAAGMLQMVSRADPRAVRIQVLGGFSIVRQGQQVRLSDWQSKRARELLKMLIARRGHPTSRTTLMDALWPDDDADGLSNRLSVALTTIRAVLDPSHRFAAEHFIRADKDSVAVNLDAMDVDLERFLAGAAEGLGRLRERDATEAIPILEAAEVAYGGEFLEENLYDDWATPVREEARAMYSSVARSLAQHAADRDEPDVAVRYLLRILEIDRYDEDANLRLVRALSAAGRHGEAHRHYLNYRHAMDELGVEPVPFPGVRHPV
jgi:ATP/maltotriose-dependent transcriptional regulator MalT/DNA-binding SARP family transcriptional activator